VSPAKVQRCESVMPVVVRLLVIVWSENLIQFAWGDTAVDSEHSESPSHHFDVPSRKPHYFVIASY
jgi:hypothetical protein